jgi:quinol monooxygenase YgiN
MAMITCMLHILVREGCEAEAIETLSAIERDAQRDPGRVQFTWLQHDNDPYRFTLFEQWESQQHLDDHLKRDPSRWERFVPCLAADPRSETLRGVSEMAAPPSPDEVRPFVQEWFDRLSAHEPVENLLPMVAAGGAHGVGGLVMEFPDATLTSEAEFRKWYQEVGQAFYDQSHVLDRLDITQATDAPAADVDLSVVWTTRQTSDGTQRSFRALQSWWIARSFLTGRPVIVRYQVRELTEIPVPASASG